MSGFPIRCFTCGKCIGSLEKTIEKMKEDNIKINAESLKKHNVWRYCCIRMIMGYVEIEVYPNEDLEKKI